MASLTTCASALMGISLRPQTEHQNNVAALLKDVSNAPKYSLNPNIRALIYTEELSDIGPSESIRFLAKHGLPFPEGSDLLWIEGAMASRDTDHGSHGLLFKRHADGQGYTVHDAQIVGDATSTGKAVKQRIKGKQPNPLLAGIYYNQRTSVICGLSGCGIELRFGGTEAEPHHTMTMTGLDVFLQEDEGRGEDRVHTDTAQMQESLRSDLRNLLRFSLHVMTFMAHEKLEREALAQTGAPVPPIKKETISPFLPAISKAYRARLNQMESPDALRRFLGVTPITTPLLSNTIPDYIDYGIAENKILTSPLSAIMMAAFHAVPISFDHKVCALTRRVMEAVPEKTIQRLFQQAGTQFKELWIEGPYTAPASIGKEAHVPVRIGAFIQQEGADCCSVLHWQTIEKPPLQTSRYITVEGWSVEALLHEKTAAATPFAPKDVQNAIKIDIKKFVTALLVLSRARTDVAKEAGLDGLDALSSMLKESNEAIAIKHPFIRNANPDWKATRVDVTQRKTRVVGTMRAFVLSEKSQQWEDAKQTLRDSFDDLLTPDNFFALNREVAMAAKEMFGQDVTARAFRVAQSRPIPKPVNEGTYSRAEHVRIDLFFEEKDLAKSALRNAAYQLTATRASAAAINVDDRNTLVLTVPDAALRHNAALTL